MESGPVVEIEGKQVFLLPWNRGDFDMARALLRSTQADPLEGLNDRIKDLHPEVQKAIGLEAFRESRRLGELNTEAGRRYFSSNEGIAFFIWRSAVKGHPEITLEQCQAFVASQDEKRNELIMKKLQEIYFGEDELKNSKRPSRPKTKGPKRKSRSTGTTSTGSSLSDTHGRRRKLLSGLHIAR